MWLRPKKLLLSISTLNDSTIVSAGVSSPNSDWKSLVALIASPLSISSHLSPWAQLGSFRLDSPCPTILWTAELWHRHQNCLRGHSQLRKVEGPPAMASWLWTSARHPEKAVCVHVRFPQRHHFYSEFWGNSSYLRITWEYAYKKVRQVCWCTVACFYASQKGFWWQKGVQAICSSSVPCKSCRPHLSEPLLSWRSCWLTAMNHSARAAHNCLICVFSSQI